MKLISGSSNPTLAKNLAQELDIEQVKVELSKFANDEKRVQLNDSVQGETVIVVQSFSQPVDEHIMEFLLLTDALERAGAKKVYAIIPWYGYSLQDKVFNDGEPLSAKVVANLISNSYTHRVFLLDVHNPSIAGFFSVPTHHLSALPLFQKYVEQNFALDQAVVASPDFGGLKKAAKLAKTLNLDLANIEKSRDLQTGKIIKMELHGEVKNKIVLVFDDVIVSGGTLIEATEVLKKAGAKEIHFLATHALLVNEAESKLQKSSLDSVIVSNSITQDNLPDKFKAVDCAPYFAQKLTGLM